MHPALARRPDIRGRALVITDDDPRVTFMIGSDSATINPPDRLTFEVDVDSDEALVGDTVENRGSDAGQTTVTLAVDGTPTANRTVAVPATTAVSVTFTYAPNATGTYDLTVANASAGILTVTAPGGGDDGTDDNGTSGNDTGGNATLPANITVTNTSLSTTTATVGDTVTVAVTLRNTGDRNGSTVVTLTANGSVVAGPVVSVPGRSTTTITTEFVPDSADSYALAVDGDRVDVLAVTGASNASRPPLVDGTRPIDPDGDGVYEDFDADGNVSLIDVTIFYRQYRTPTFQSNGRFFDVNGDGRVDLLDVTRLYQQVTGSR